MKSTECFFDTLIFFVFFFCSPVFVLFIVTECDVLLNVVIIVLLLLAFFSFLLCYFRLCLLLLHSLLSL